jgi:hypothetical protein
VAYPVWGTQPRIADETIGCVSLKRALTEPTGALRDYCGLLFVGWTTSKALLASTDNGTKTAQDVAWQGHDDRVQWVQQVCEQAAMDGLPVWSEADWDITDHMLASIGTIEIVGAVELLRADGSRYPFELLWRRDYSEMNRLIEADWGAELRDARARVGARRTHAPFLTTGAALRLASTPPDGPPSGDTGSTSNPAPRR